MLQLKQLGAGNRAEWLVEKRYTFGTGVDNHYPVTGDGIIEIHAGLEVNGDNIQLFNLGGGLSVTVNGKVLEKNQVLSTGDEFTVGDNRFKIEDPKQNRKAKPAGVSQPEGWTLKAKNTALENKSFPLDGSQTIGRSKECEICLNVVHLSRRHAQITVKDNYLQIDDLKSSNGTFINGRRVESAQAKSGDEIGFDTLKFSVFGPSASLANTQVRQAAPDSDATTMRPAIMPETLVPQVKKGTAQKKEKPAQSAKQPSPVKADASPVQNIEKSESKTGKLLFGGILVLIAAAAAYVFLG